jgi:hypothetical protein
MAPARGAIKTREIDERRGRVRARAGVDTSPRERS